MEFDRTEEFAMMMDHEIDGARMFGKKIYDDAFNDLFERYKSVMQAYVNSCAALSEEDLSEYREKVAEAFIAREEARLDAAGARNRRVRLYDDNLYMALFVIPAIGYFKTEQTDALAKTLVKRWRKQYPQHPINQGNYEEISAGFKKRKFCYITTAVCESLGKDDHCEELETLRDFRDHWLLLTENGPALVDQYYETAPGVLEAIRERDDYKEICQEIYTMYISPCLKYIHRGQYEDCRRHYMDMVDRLERMYV